MDLPSDHDGDDAADDCEAGLQTTSSKRDVFCTGRTSVAGQTKVYAGQAVIVHEACPRKVCQQVVCQHLQEARRGGGVEQSRHFEPSCNVVTSQQRPWRSWLKSVTPNLFSSEMLFFCSLKLVLFSRYYYVASSLVVQSKWRKKSNDDDGVVCDHSKFWNSKQQVKNSYGRRRRRSSRGISEHTPHLLPTCTRIIGPKKGLFTLEEVTWSPDNFPFQQKAEPFCKLNIKRLPIRHAFFCSRAPRLDSHTCMFMNTYTLLSISAHISLSFFPTHSPTYTHVSTNNNSCTIVLSHYFYNHPITPYLIALQTPSLSLSLSLLHSLMH